MDDYHRKVINTWQRVEDEQGVFWPCPEVGHPGVRRLYEGGEFYTPNKRGQFQAIRYRDPAEVVDDDYPVWLTTGRVVSQYLSGTQTRRIGPLVDQFPEPLMEIHPKLADQHGITDGDLVRVRSRRGSMDLPARVVTRIRPDTVFIPYHWAGGQAANQLTNRALDPISKIPEYKVATVRLERLGERRDIVDIRASRCARCVAMYETTAPMPVPTRPAAPVTTAGQMSATRTSHTAQRTQA